MKLGLIGLPMSGKSTIYSALTGQEMAAMGGIPGRVDVQIAVVEVPDPRLDALSDLYNPKKKVPAKITYADIGGLAKGIGSDGLSGAFRNELNQMDAFLVVIRAFPSDSVPHPEETVDPQRDLDILDSEFLFADLVIVENRMEKLKEEIRKTKKNREENQRELVLFERLLASLEEEKPLRLLGLTHAELQPLKGYGFLTTRPRLVLLNMGDEGGDASALVTSADGSGVIGIQGELEMEISQLEDDEATMFMEEYGITEPVRDRAINESYSLLGVQTFFTVGEDECRAWTHSIGATAQEAAGVIHSDLERGFIRAEIIPQDLLLELGSEAEVRNIGKLQVEGKNYIMRDGDVMNVRFNV